MGKTAKSPRKQAPRSTKTRRLAPAKSSRSVKSARTNPTGPRANGKPRAKRRKDRTLGTSVDRCIATIDGWCKDCAGKLRRLVRDRAAHARAATKTRRGRNRHAPGWIESGARQVGLGVRHTAQLADPRKLFTPSSKKARRRQFNRLRDFCKKELKELAALASKLDALANNPPRRARCKRK